LAFEWIMEFEVSIHAPRTGRDREVPLHDLFDGVSIHAPRTGRDS